MMDAKYKASNYNYLESYYSKVNPWTDGGKLAFNTRVEAPITNHLRSFVPDSEKYKVVQIFPYRKIDIRRISFF